MSACRNKLLLLVTVNCPIDDVSLLGFGSMKKSRIGSHETHMNNNYRE
jgi:hypothetical protein